jgi:hypothetical protein
MTDRQLQVARSSWRQRCVKTKQWPRLEVDSGRQLQLPGWAHMHLPLPLPSAQHNTHTLSSDYLPQNWLAAWRGPC